VGGQTLDTFIKAVSPAWVDNRKVAAAVESFATNGDATSRKIRSGDEGALPDDRRDKVADDTTQILHDNG